MIFSEVQHKHLNFESGSLFLFRLDRFPGCVRVETLHLFECVEGSWPEVLLIDHAVVADDEGPHTRYAILGGCSDQSKTADHRSLHDKVQFAERGCRSLPLQNLEEVAMVRLRATGIALFQRLGAIFSPIRPPHVPAIPRRAPIET
jgi:hypothetical protein